jgi:hypothetical protein
MFFLLTLAKLFWDQRPVLKKFKSLRIYLSSNFFIVKLKYGFIGNLTSTLAIGKFDDKKGICLSFYCGAWTWIKMKTRKQKVTGGQSERGQSDRGQSDQDDKVTGEQSDRGQNDRGTKWPGDKVKGDKVTGDKGTRGQSDRDKVTGDKVKGDKV